MNKYYLFKDGKLMTIKITDYLSSSWHRNYEFDFICCQYAYDEINYSYWVDKYIDKLNEKDIPEQTLNLMKLELMLESN